MLFWTRLDAHQSAAIRAFINAQLNLIESVWPLLKCPVTSLLADLHHLDSMIKHRITEAVAARLEHSLFRLRRDDEPLRRAADPRFPLATSMR